MAIKSDVNFRGIILNDMYIKIEKIINSTPEIEVSVSFYSIVDGKKDQFIQRQSISLDNNKEIIALAYNSLKSQFFKNGIQI